MKHNYKLCRLVTLFVVLHLYYYLGAVVYVYLEECDHENSPNSCDDGYRYRRVNITRVEYLSLLCTEIQAMRNHTKFNENIKNICNDILQIGNHTRNKNKTVAKETHCTKWSVATISKWQVFCLVILYTIGYGNIVPKTDVGKMFTIIYAAVGVPLNLALLTSTADTCIAILMSCNEKFQRNILKRKKVRQSNTGLAMLLGILTMGVILAGAASSTHKKMENLRFLDAVYYWFITVSTIGLGDFYYEPKRYTGWDVLYALPGYILVIVGMSVLASMISSVSKCIQENAGKKVSIIRKHHKVNDT